MSGAGKNARRRLRAGPNNFCFVCGADNPRGLGLRFDCDERARRIRGRFRLDESCQGPPGFVHGGIIAALLDEAMGKLSRLAGAPAVTAALEVRYLRPIRVGESILVEARERGRQPRRGREFRRAAEIRTAAGELAASGRGRFVAVEFERFARKREKAATRAGASRTGSRGGTRHS
jgi:uncharacterized protein (TIGR00369 family)